MEIFSHLLIFIDISNAQNRMLLLSYPPYANFIQLSEDCIFQLKQWKYPANKDNKLQNIFMFLDSF